MSSKPSKGHISKYSITAGLILLAALVQEFGSLLFGLRGGAFSHIVWWAAGDVYSWRWVAVLAPICGLLSWCLPHFIWQWGTGVHLLGFVAVWGVLLGFLALTR